jgi:hypothetical protein
VKPQEPVIRGKQTPRIELIPKAAYTETGDDAVRYAAAAGLHLDPWQEYVVKNMLGERLDYKWSAREVGIVVPRQQGKSALLEARMIAGLFLFNERILYTSHLLESAREIFNRLIGLIRSTPELEERVEQIYTGNTQSKIVLKSGLELQIGARTPDQGRGKSFDVLVMDEAYALTSGEVAALTPTLTTASNPQTIYASSAGMPKSEVLAKIRERGQDETTKSFAYFEWSAPDDADPDDIEALIMANPGLGIRMDLEHVAQERGSMSDEEFKRERLGQWAKIGGENAIPERDWLDLLDPDSAPGTFAAFAVDVPRSGDSANVVAVSAREDGRLHAEVIQRRNGISWVPLYLKQLQQAWGPQGTQVFLDRAGAASALEHDLALERVKYSFLSSQQIARSCAVLFDDVVERRLVHRGQVELDEAVEQATTKPVGDNLWKFVGTSKNADLSPLYGLVLARAGWSLRGEKKDRNKRRRDQGGAVGRGASRRGAARRTAGRR